MGDRPRRIPAPRRSYSPGASATEWPAATRESCGGKAPSISSHRNLGEEPPAVSLRRSSSLPESSTTTASIMPAVKDLHITETD